MVKIASNKNIKGITVEIGGDVQGLDKALDSVDNKSKDLSSELKQVNKLLKLDPDNVVLLAQKQKILSEQVENSAEKLEKLKSVQDQIERQYASGEIDEGAYRRFQREIEDTEIALKRANDQIDNTSKNMDKVEDKTTTFGSKLKSAAKTAATAFKAAAAAAAAVGTALVKTSLDAATYADEILTISTNTGLSTEYLQAYAYAAELVDVDLKTMTTSMAKNIKSMTNAQKGTEDYVNAYKKLGVKVSDSNGALRDSEEVYWDVIDALGKIDDETERDSISMQIFGKSAQELNSLIAVGSEGLKEYAAEADEMGAVLDEKTLSSLGDLDDSFQRLQASSTAWRNQIGAIFAPEITTAINKITAFVTKNMPKITSFLKSAKKYVSSFLPSIKSIYDSGKKIVKTVLNIVGDIGKKLEPTIQNVVSFTKNVLKLIPTILKKAYTFLKPIISAVATVVEWVTSLAAAWTGIIVNENKAHKEVDILRSKTDELKDSVSETKSEWDDLNEAAANSLIEADEEINDIERLRSRLSLLVDETGNLVGSEDELQTILKKLSDEGFTVNYDAQNRQISNYQKLQDEIQKTIELKLYESRINTLSVLESEAWQTQADTKKQIIDLTEQQLAVANKLRQLGAIWNEENQTWLYLPSGKNSAEVEELKEQYDGISKAVKTAESAYESASGVIEAYNQALTAGETGDYSAAIKIAEDAVKSWSTTTETITAESLDEIEEAMKLKIASIYKLLDDYGVEFATQAMGELDDYISQYTAMGGDTTALLADFLALGEAISNAVNDGLNSDGDIGSEYIRNLISTFDSIQTQMAPKIESDFKKFGAEIPEVLSVGIQTNSSAAENATQSVVDASADADTSGFFVVGKNMGAGIVNGLKAMLPNIVKQASSVVNSAMTAMKKASDEHSPSKKTRQIGAYMGEGLELGLLDRIRDVQNVSARLAKSAIAPIAATTTTSFTVNNTNNFNTTAARDGTALVRQINRELGSLYYKR